MEIVMTSQKDLLPYILIYFGPKSDRKLRFLATDAGAGMQIAMHASASIEAGWAERLSKIFERYVDPRTLATLREEAAQVVKLSQEGGTLWVFPDGLRCMGP